MGISNWRRAVLAIGFTTAFFSALSYADDSNKKLAVDKVKGELSIIVLGSGGPMPSAEGRASAGYLILTDGQPRLLMDVGGGTYQRLAASGAHVQNIDSILISHLHVDHMADLSAMIKGVYFHARQYDEPRPASRPIHIYGPNENLANAQTAQFPSSEKYVNTLFDPVVGIERYLNGFSTAINKGKFAYDVTNISPSPIGPATEIINDADGLVVKAIGVFHGPVPSVAFRVDYKGKSVVYTGDTNSKLPNGDLSQALISLAMDTDLLIYDTAITDTRPDKFLPADNPPLGDQLFFLLHTTPTTMGQIAMQAKAKTLVLSHITPVTENSLDEVKDLVRAQGYTGKISVARDLKVYNLDKDED